MRFKFSKRILALVGFLFILYSCKQEYNQGTELVFNIVGIVNGNGPDKAASNKINKPYDFVKSQKVTLKNGNTLLVEVNEAQGGASSKFAANPVSVYQSLPTGTILYYGIFGSDGSPVKSGNFTYSPGSSYDPIMLSPGQYKIIFLASINNVLPSLNFNVELDEFQLNNLPISNDLLLFEQDLTVVGQNTTQNINIVMTHQLTRIRAVVDATDFYAPGGITYGDLEIKNSYNQYNFKLENPKISKTGSQYVVNFLKANANNTNPKIIEYNSGIIISGNNPLTDSLELLFKNLVIGGLTQDLSIRVGGLLPAKSYVVKLQLFAEMTESSVTYAPGNLMYQNGDYFFAGAQDKLGDLWVYRMSGQTSEYAPVLAGGVIGPYVSNPCGKVTGYGTGWMMMGQDNYINKVTTGSFSNGNVAFKLNGNGAIYNGASSSSRAYYGPATAKTSYGFYVGVTSQPSEATQSSYIFLPAGSGSNANPPIEQLNNDPIGIYWVDNYSATGSGSWTAGMLYFKNFVNGTPQTTFLRGDQQVQGRIRCIK